jgi:hypothetical protein
VATAMDSKAARVDSEKKASRRKPPLELVRSRGRRPWWTN